MKKLIGREREVRELQKSLDSDESEFVIVYGRRRVGKTFLVEQFFRGKYDFSYTGGHKLTTRVQLMNFAKALKKYAHLKSRPVFTDWFAAFDALEEYFDSMEGDRRKVIFIDEMPWIDTARSEFVIALENFWNGWAARRHDILLVASGSASSWMIDKLVDNPGGLHARINTQIYLRPFNLHETEIFLRSRHITWEHYQILQTYMTFGGIPYYLNLLDGKESLMQNINRLFFTKNGKMRIEFDELYNALFNHADNYISIVSTLAKHRDGLSRKELHTYTGIDMTQLGKMLRNLERCDFILSYQHFGHKSRDIIYRLVDFYTLFYYRFIANDQTYDDQWWTHHNGSPAINEWQGYSFELIGLLHLPQIKHALGISGMATEASAWHQSASKDSNVSGAQVDLIISRADRIIHLCEMKFSIEPYHLTTQEANRLRERAGIFRAATKTTHALVHTYVTTFGVANINSFSVLHSQVTMDDLFHP